MNKRDRLIETRDKLFSLSGIVCVCAHTCETVAKYIQLSLVDNEFQGFASTNLDDRRRVRAFFPPAVNRGNDVPDATSDEKFKR